MADDEQFRRLGRSSIERNGCSSWNWWRRQDFDASSGRYATAINLRDANLPGYSLNHVNLCGANLSGANLNNASLSGADLSGADLSDTRLHQAYLHRANLSSANLTNATLRHARLSGADLTGAVLDGTSLYRVASEGVVWPTPDENMLNLLYQEAKDPQTLPDRLSQIAWQWPGILLQDVVTVNPNIAPSTLIELASYQPLPFLRNPVVPLLFLMDAQWLTQWQASHILDVVTSRVAPELVTEEDGKIMRLLHQIMQT